MSRQFEFNLGTTSTRALTDMGIHHHNMVVSTINAMDAAKGGRMKNKKMIDKYSKDSATSAQLHDEAQAGMRTKQAEKLYGKRGMQSTTYMGMNLN